MVLLLVLPLQLYKDCCIIFIHYIQQHSHKSGFTCWLLLAGRLKSTFVIDFLEHYSSDGTLEVSVTHAFM